MMSRAELEDLRRRNRAALGLSGLGACCPSCAAGGSCEGCPRQANGMSGMAAMIPGLDAALIPSVGIETSFPPMSVQWSPGKATPDVQSGPGWGQWLMGHVVRPVVTVGGVRVAPYEAVQGDYSGIATGLAILAFFGAAAGGAWILFRAFGRIR